MSNIMKLKAKYNSWRNEKKIKILEEDMGRYKILANRLEDDFLKYNISEDYKKSFRAMSEQRNVTEYVEYACLKHENNYWRKLLNDN